MYNKTSFINDTDYAEVSGTRWIMRDLPNYAEGHQLCARIIQRSLVSTIRRQSMQSLAFLQAEWILMLTDCTSVSIPLSQVVCGRPQGLLQ